MARVLRRPRTAEMEPEVTQEEQAGFWESMGGLDEKAWEHHKLYVYRVAPRIDNGDNRAYIAKYSTPVDEAQLLAEHGSGRYLLLLNDTTARRTIAKITFTAHHDDYPPKVRLDQVVDCPENGKWMAWLRQTDQNQQKQPATDSPSQDGANAAVENIARMALEGKQRLDPQIIDLWTKTAAERDQLAQRLAESSAAAPNPMLMLREVMTTAKDLNPPQAKTDSLEILDRLLSVSARLAPAPPPPVANPMEQLSQVASLFTQLRETFGAQHVEPAAAGPSLGVQFLTALAPAVVPLTQAIAARLLRADAPAMPQTSDADMGLEQKRTPPAPTAIVPRTPPPQHDPTRELADQIVPMLINALNVGATGDYFASSIVTLFGNMAYEVIAMNGKDQILAVLQTHPMWPQLAPLQNKLGQFIEEFLSYGKADEDESNPAA